jgi:hypothetical protein
LSEPVGRDADDPTLAQVRTSVTWSLVVATVVLGALVWLAGGILGAFWVMGNFDSPSLPGWISFLQVAPLVGVPAVVVVILLAGNRGRFGRPL